mmetsp:Transcript_34066/g.65945  ORF Transcript_34066/g.65945 Transcript_34066/m.65945 type:complete len:195 (+) Transcript_34066:67-651(+)
MQPAITVELIGRTEAFASIDHLCLEMGKSELVRLQVAPSSTVEPIWPRMPKLLAAADGCWLLLAHCYICHHASPSLLPTALSGHPPHVHEWTTIRLFHPHRIAGLYDARTLTLISEERHGWMQRDEEHSSVGLAKVDHTSLDNLRSLESLCCPCRMSIHHLLKDQATSTTASMRAFLAVKSSAPFVHMGKGSGT